MGAGVMCACYSSQMENILKKQSRANGTPVPQKLDSARVRDRRYAAGIASGLSILAFIFFAILAPKGFLFGDVPGYAEQMAAWDLGITTVHIGYIALGGVVTHLFPFDAALVLNLMSAVLAALCVGLASSIAYTITGKLSSCVAGVALLGMPIFMYHGVFAEIYIAQLFFFLLSVQFCLWDRPLASGVSFAFAFLITPSTILTVPFIVLLRPKKQFLLRWALSAFAVAAVVLAPNYKDFLWGGGGRGVLNLQAGELNLAGALSKEWGELGEVRSLPLLAFAATGLWALWASPKRRQYVLAIACLWLIPFIFGEKYFDVPVQIPFYALMAVSVGIGFSRLVHAGSKSVVMRVAVAAAACLAVILPAIPAYSTTEMWAEQTVSFRSDVLIMREQVGVGDLVIAGWPQDRIARYDVSNRDLVWVDSEQLFGALGADVQAEAVGTVNAAIDKKSPIWLIDNPGVVPSLTASGYQISVVGDSGILLAESAE